MKNEHLKFHYVFMFSLLSLFSCENSLLSECAKLSEDHSSDLVSQGQEKAVAVLNQFRSEVNPETRSLPDINIKSIKSETYQIELPQQDVRAKSSISNSDTIDIYTIVFEKDGKTGFSILSPDERVGRMYAYTEDGSISDTISNKGLALHLNGIKEICEADLAIYYTNCVNSKITRAQGTMYPNFMYFEWAQTEPFNALCPKVCGSKPALAGRFTVAAAEIIMYYKKKYYDWFGEEGLSNSNSRITMNVQSNSDARSVDPNSYDYKLLKDYFRIINSSPEAVKNEAARLMYDIAVLLKSRWGCGVSYGDDTCADFADAEAVFGPFIGTYFKNTYPERYEILELFESNISKIDKQKMISHIALKNPIMVQGLYSYGPIRSVWLYTGVKFRGTTIDEFYINWGGGGSSNGWYAFNNNLGYVPYEVLFVNAVNPDATPGGGTIQ